MEGLFCLLLVFLFSCESRLLFFDVNPGEGFNLRRDVYMRVVELAQTLQGEFQKTGKEDLKIVLPPWGRIYHWRYSSISTKGRIPWKAFFDLESMSKVVPVVDLEDVLVENFEIEQIYILQRYSEGWGDGGFQEKMDERPCLDRHGYVHVKEVGHWEGPFWGFHDSVHAKHLKCISFQGHASSFAASLTNHTWGSVMIARAEVLLHDRFGDANFWKIRRSMRFSSHLVAAADAFRETELTSNDLIDKTTIDKDWRSMKRNHGDALGGPYVGVHLRRQDFLRSRSQHVPSLKNAVHQINLFATEYDLKTVFIATDAFIEEKEELVDLLANSSLHGTFFTSPEEILDGGLAIIDQIICSHARVFVGSYESTFSFRIQDEREIMGFEPKTTFNRFCGDEEEEGGERCEQGSKWHIVYD